MSHFTCLVIGPNPEKQLARFHEFECTGEDNEFVEDVDITHQILKLIEESEEATPEEKLLDALEYHGIETVSDPDQLDLSETHKYGYAVVVDGKLVKAINRTNPRAKWDWYSLGGRWTGFFKIKEGQYGTQGRPGLMTEACKPGYADSAQLDWIDLDGMRDEKGTEAAGEWNLAMEIIGDTPENEPWNSLRERFLSEGKTIDEAQKAYRDQPRVKAWDEDKRTSQAFGFFSSPEDFTVTREQYVQRARDGAISTFAVLKDGEWYERGSMGWWGCVSDEKDVEAWGRQLASLLDGLPGDTRLSVYDCHV